MNASSTPRSINGTLFCMAMLLIAPATFAQSEEVLLARTAKNTVFIDVDPAIKDIRLLGNATDVDHVLWEYATKETEPLVLIKDNTYNLRLRVTNPLRYQVTVRGQIYEDDPYFEALNNVANSLQQIVNTVTHGTMPFGSVAEGDLRQLVDGEALGTQLGIVDPYRIDLTTPKEEAIAGTDEIRDYGLRRAMMLYVIVNARPDKKQITTLSAIVSKAKGVEQYASKNMLAKAAEIIKQLMLIDLSTEDAKETYKGLEQLIDSLERDNGIMAGQLKSLADLRPEPDWWTIPTPFGSKELQKASGKNVMRFVELSLEEFVETMDKLLRQRRALVQNLNTLLGVVQRVGSTISKTEHGTDLIYGQVIPAGKTEKVVVAVKEREIEVGADYSIKMKETELFERELKFMRAHTFYPQLFPAAVFVNAIYPEFGAVEDSVGIQRVRRKDNSQGYLNLAAMVNFNFKLQRRTEVPFIQLGASSKKEQPQVFLGGGIRFAEWLAVSVGAAFTWEGSLNKLTEGEQVNSQQVINDDLRYRMSDPRFYLSIQLRPGSLTKKPG